MVPETFPLYQHHFQDGARPDDNFETYHSVLIPAQAHVAEHLLGAMFVRSALWLDGSDGRGKTTVLRELHRALGGVIITARDVVDALRDRHPFAIEAAIVSLLLDALQHHTYVFIDDADMISSLLGNEMNPRQALAGGIWQIVIAYAGAAEKKLFAAGSSGAPEGFAPRGEQHRIHSFKPRDYEALFARLLGAERSTSLDTGAIYRSAPNLNAHQLSEVCAWIGWKDTITTDEVVQFLADRNLITNVDVGEVEAADLADLKGIDDVIEQIEAHIVLPFENGELARELQLQPRRGVLIAGPPGSGKTTIGRALAHRLKGRFFLVDGTFIAGSAEFYRKLNDVVEQAKNNGVPCVLFIDDSDVIFESGKDTGLYRYMLTMLDGLESKSAGRICVMLTAMDLTKLPPALLRSGRIELWLETRLPDQHARRAILMDRLTPVMEVIGAVDCEALVAATEGFTGADLKRLAEDGKTLLAHDRARNRPARPATEYFLQAVETLRDNKARYEVS